MAALAAVMLARQYMKSRPLNLREQTTALADIFEQALVNCRVPKEGIARGKQEPHLDAGASWWALTFDVDLPETMDGSALIKLVARRMQPYNVGLIESSFENSVRKAVASLGEREFIVLNIKEKPPKTDLSEACERVVRGVNAWLESQGVLPVGVEVTQPERKEDNEFVWQYVRMSAPCPAGLPLDSVETQVRESAGQSVGTDKAGLRVAASIGLGGTTTFAASLGGRTCLDLVLTRTEVEPSAEEPSAGTLPLLHAGPDEETPDATIPNIEDLPLDSAGLEDMELGRRLTGVSTPANEIPRIALIVDDGGYGGPATNSFLALDPNLTLAILPNTPFAARTAKRAEELGFEVMLHMPMESPETPGRLATNTSET
ncbi:MAG: divergent polysaccharide deacetylase family protein, partial [Candidatus Hydrogenedentes bacterium]|nr:divergent polysaccharide deacetylase family protein [Candidatus Hydrogenedentota bacterium]